MAAYLIDYENVKSEGIYGISSLNENDTVVIFYSSNAETISFEAMDMIFNSKASIIKYKIVRVGKNSLDFQLATYLGYLIREAKDSFFYIISKDNGFQHVVEFWKKVYHYSGYVYCFPTIADAYSRQRRFDSISEKERQKEVEAELLALTPPVEDEEEGTETVSEETGEAAETVIPVTEPEPMEPVQEQKATEIPDSEEEDQESEDSETENSETENSETESIPESKIVPESETLPESPSNSEPEETAVTEAPVQETSYTSSHATVTVHESDLVIMPAEVPEKAPELSMPKSNSSESTLGKIAAAVSNVTVTVVNNDPQIHQVTEEQAQAAESKETAVNEEKEETPNVPAPKRRKPIYRGRNHHESDPHAETAPKSDTKRSAETKSADEAVKESQKETVEEKSADVSGKKNASASKHSRKPVQRKQSASTEQQAENKAAKESVKEETSTRESDEKKKKSSKKEKTSSEEKPAKEAAENSSANSEAAEAPKKRTGRGRRPKQAAPKPDFME